MKVLWWLICIPVSMSVTGEVHSEGRPNTVSASLRVKSAVSPELFDFLPFCSASAFLLCQDTCTLPWECMLSSSSLHNIRSCY